MTNIRSISHSDLIREAKRRGLEVRHPQVELTPCERSVVASLMGAAEACQAGDVDVAERLSYVAYFAAENWSWLHGFAHECWLGACEWLREANSV